MYAENDLARGIGTLLGTVVSLYIVYRFGVKPLVKSVWGFFSNFSKGLKGEDIQRKP